MSGFFEDTVFRTAGLDDQDIADYKAAMLDLANLIHVAQTHQAQFNRVASTFMRLGQKIATNQGN